MLAHPPPPAYDDMLYDADPPDGFTDVDVPKVGVVRMRRPSPKSAAMLGAATNAKITDLERAGYQNLFVQTNTAEGEFERLLVGMVKGDMPEDTVMEVVRAIATLGTTRPTRRSHR